MRVWRFHLWLQTVNTVIDANGFRANVGIILLNDESKVFWAKRIGQNAWQFPQGGIRHEETPKQALYRELMEEVGLNAQQVKIVGYTQRWLHYRLPNYLIRHHKLPLCVGQKQRWYILRLLSDDAQVNLCKTTHPEFDSWRWVDYWHPLKEVVFFKRNVYRQALNELSVLRRQAVKKSPLPYTGLTA